MPFTLAPPAGTATNPTANLSLTDKIVSDILSLQGETAQDSAQAQASRLEQSGRVAESGAYGTAEQIANQNVALEASAGQIQRDQLSRAVAQSIGTQRAAISAAGFGNAGSNVALLRSSVRQGYLADQLVATQTELSQSGYLQQAQAAGAEKSAADVAAQQAGVLASAAEQATTTARVNSTNETAALTDYLKGFTATPEQNLITGVLSGNPDIANLSRAANSSVNPTQPGLFATGQAGVSSILAHTGLPSTVI